MDGCTTKPAVHVSATSGTSWPLEPERTTGLVCKPPRAGSFKMPKPVVLGPYSSLTFGARMSRDRVPRIRNESMSRQFKPSFQVVVLTVDEPAAGLLRS